jgi:16S rRNA (uracil1498-N3)-methyltransferase
MAGSAIDGSDFIASGPNDFDNTPVSVPRFHVDKLASGNVSLPDEEARHALGSRRLSVGDAVTLFDGQGAEAAGRIASPSRRGVDVTIDEIRHSPRPVPALTLAVAPPKGPRQDMLIEKCTELSVAGIIPLLCQRAVASVSQHRLNKWRRTTIEAAKQSGQCWLPTLQEPRSLEQVLADAPDFDQVLVATCAGPACPTPASKQAVTPMPITELFGALRNVQSVLALVGPEGGWSTGEIEQSLSAGARPVLLGPNTLRIETAAIVVAAAVHAIMRAGR